MKSTRGWSVSRWLALVCLLMSPLVSQSADDGGASPEAWRKVEAAARNEGRVVLYGNPFPALVDRIKADFQALHPAVRVEFSRVVGTALISNLEQERKAKMENGADVVFAPEIMWFEKAAKEGLLTPPSGPSSRSWASSFMIAGTVPVVSVAPFVIAYNTNLVKTPVTGYRDLLQPEFKGKIGTADPIAESIVAWYDWLEKTQGDGFLRSLAAQAPRSFAGAFPATQSLAAGEVAVVAFTVPTQVLELVKNGAPIKMVVPKPSLGISYGSAILGWARHPNAAQLFVDYLMSPRGQAAINGYNESASPLPKIPGSMDVTQIRTYDPKPFTNEAVIAFQAKYRSQFQSK